MTLIKRCQGRRHSTSKKIKIERSQPQLQLWHLLKTFEKEAKNENPSDRIEALRCFGFKSWLKCEAVGVMPWKRDSFSLFSNSHFQFLSHSLSNMFAHALKLSLSLSCTHYGQFSVFLSINVSPFLQTKTLSTFAHTCTHTFTPTQTHTFSLTLSLTAHFFLSLPSYRFFFSFMFVYFYSSLLE